MTPTKEELAATVDVAEWRLLRGHLERGGLILVDRELDLVEAGVRVANDDAATIGSWIEVGKLVKPSAEQIAAWDAADDKQFRMLIISPYVFIQDEGLTVNGAVAHG